MPHRSAVADTRAATQSATLAEIFGDVVEDSDDDNGGDDEELEENDYPCVEHEAALEAACDGPSVGSSTDDAPE